MDARTFASATSVMEGASGSDISGRRDRNVCGLGSFASYAVSCEESRSRIGEEDGGSPEPKCDSRENDLGRRGTRGS